MAKYQILIPDMSAVGMHHWGDRQLTVGKLYEMRAEPPNPNDTNAVAMYETTYPYNKRAYLIREAAKIIQPILLKYPSVVSGRMKVLSPAIVTSYEKGPEHNCTIVFYCSEQQKGTIEDILKLSDTHHIVYKL